MIWESSYWKDDLLKTARKLERKKNQKRWPERALVNFEKEMFISFYSIRKLIEANKISTDLIETIITAKSYPSLGKVVTSMNWHRIDELYDFSTSNIEKLLLTFICNQLIHSYVFMTSFNENNQLTGILFSSDRYRNKKLFSMDINDVIEILRKVGSNYPNISRSIYDEKKKDYIITSRMMKNQE